MTERESDTYRRGLSLGLTMAEIFILILFLLLLVSLALYAFNAELQREIEIHNNAPPPPITITPLKVCAGNLVECQNENKIVVQKIAELEEQLEKARQKIAELEKMLEELLQPPGIDPPCWYKVIDREGKRHEKPHYLMDIAVYDKYLEIRAQEAPPGRAIDERGQPATTSYQEEYEKLPLPLLGTTKKVSLQQFAEITEPIKRMGKNKQIRDYACVFYVKVWDFTPETAKPRWKEAEDAIKDSFYTYRVRNDPW